VYDRAECYNICQSATTLSASQHAELEALLLPLLLPLLLLLLVPEALLHHACWSCLPLGSGFASVT
jgi:hypothetical protein